jgi:hypothetical protein
VQHPTRGAKTLQHLSEVVRVQEVQLGSINSHKTSLVSVSTVYEFSLVYTTRYRDASTVAYTTGPSRPLPRHCPTSSTLCCCSWW